MNEKTHALLVTAMAYYNRGKWLQYDQLSMDRILRVTSRRNKKFPPEAATEQNILFLDCSSFIWSVYYQTFGYELEADLTWEMIDLVKPRVYYHVLTHKETVEEIDTIVEEMKGLIKAGDIIVYEGNGNGHAMLYIGNNKYLNCTQNSIFCGYNYKDKYDCLSLTGSMLIEDVQLLFRKNDDLFASRNYLFNENVNRFCILRPLDIVNEIKPNALARIKRLNNLKCSVLSSLPGGHTVDNGSEIEYAIVVENHAKHDVYAEIDFFPMQHLESLTKLNRKINIPAGEKRTECFPFRVMGCRYNEIISDTSKIKVSGLEITISPIKYGYEPKITEVDILINAFNRYIYTEDNAYAVAAKAYNDLGINMPLSSSSCLKQLFLRHDSIKGAVLSRREQKPYNDMAVYSLFGGFGVITPEIGWNSFIRTTKVLTSDLQNGDIIVCCENAFFTDVASYFYYDGKLYDGIKQVTNDEVNMCIDSLFGRFCFVILRPFLHKG